MHPPDDKKRLKSVCPPITDDSQVTSGFKILLISSHRLTTERWEDTERQMCVWRVKVRIDNDYTHPTQQRNKQIIHCRKMNSRGRGGSSLLDQCQDNANFFLNTNSFSNLILNFKCTYKIPRVQQKKNINIVFNLVLCLTCSISYRTVLWVLKNRQEKVKINMSM